MSHFEAFEDIIQAFLRQLKSEKAEPVLQGIPSTVLACTGTRRTERLKKNLPLPFPCHPASMSCNACTSIQQNLCVTSLLTLKYLMKRVYVQGSTHAVDGSYI